MNLNEKYLIALSHFPNFGPKSLKILKKNFPDLKEAFNASSCDLNQFGFRKKTIDKFINFRKNFSIEKVLEQLYLEKIKITYPEKQNYPKLLKEINDPPEIIFYKGDIDIKEKHSIAIVGSRKCTNYGETICKKITEFLCSYDFCIVSGLANGIDSIAHLNTINNNKKTIAVLGTGIDNRSIYPKNNKKLSNNIIEKNGLIITEFPLGTEPFRQNFPQRNRIIAGLTEATIIIEAENISGALITARFALEYNREVMAVPGNILNNFSSGSNNLIKKGAQIITKPEDILEYLNVKNINKEINKTKIKGDNEIENIILKNLSYEGTHINKLLNLTKLDQSVINSTLAMLEIKQKIKNIGGMQFVLNE